MKILIKSFILVLLFNITNCAKSNKFDKNFLENPNWFLNSVPAPLSTNFDSLINIVIPSQVEILPNYMKSSNIEGNWVIDTVGYLAGNMVVDIKYEIKYPNRNDSSILYSATEIKAVGIEINKNRYRLAYLSSSYRGDVSYKSSEIINVDNHEILYTRSQMSGTGRYFDELYLVWDDNEKIIKKLNIGNAIGFAFKKVLPPKHGVWKGGHFDINNLKFESFTWQDGDGNCCPSGGKVTINFEIIANQIFVKNAIFDYSKLEERFMYSPDSTYYNTPPLVYNRDDRTSANTIENLNVLNTTELRYEPTLSSTTLDTIINLYVRNQVSGMIYDSDRNTTEFSWSIDTIGYIETYPVFDISYKIHCKSCGRKSGRVVCIELSPNKSKLIYLETNELKEAPFEKSTIFEYNGNTVLFVPGYSTIYNFYSNNYWLVTKKNKNLIPLYQDWVLNNTLDYINSNILPDSLSIKFNTLSNGRRYRDINGKWDVKSLMYKTAVWKNSDKYTPTGGCMVIKFDIVNNRLIPVDCNLDTNITCSF